MTEGFKGGPKRPEKLKEYSAEDVRKIFQLAIKVRDLVGWDLGSMCVNSEEIQAVNDAKDSMKKIEDIFKIPKQRYWFDDKKKEKEPVVESQQLSNESFADVQESLAKIGEILGWDLAAHCRDKTDLKVVKDAERAYEELEKMLK